MTEIITNASTEEPVKQPQVELTEEQLAEIEKYKRSKLAKLERKRQRDGVVPDIEEHRVTMTDGTIYHVLDNGVWIRITARHFE